MLRQFHSLPGLIAALLVMVLAISGAVLSVNPTLERLWSMLEPFSRTYYTASVPGADLPWLADRHQSILDAIRDRDADRAAEVMHSHAIGVEPLVGGAQPASATGPTAG